MNTTSSLHPLPPPLALYYRPGRNDHGKLAEFLTGRLARARGIVFDPCLEERQKDLLEEAKSRGVETILDPKSVELGTPGGFAKSNNSALGWAAEDFHRPTDLTGASGQRFVESIAKFVVEHRYSAVLAPTHYLAKASDPWLAIDISLTNHLRSCLDRLGGSRILIYYPLALPAKAFRDNKQRIRLKGAFEGAAIDAIWIRLHSFGTSRSGPIALGGYIKGCQDLHGLRIPLVAEKCGTVGLALMAFGAVGGIESGVTLGEGFDVNSLIRPPKPNEEGFLPSPRVFIPGLEGLFLKRKDAEEFFSKSGMKATFGCKDTKCCRRGVESMIDDPRGHFLVTRAKDVEWLSGLPRALAGKLYLEERLQPATDKAILAQKSPAFPDSVRQRLESWRITLRAIEDEAVRRTYSPVPEGRRLPRERLA